MIIKVFRKNKYHKYYKYHEQTVSNISEVTTYGSIFDDGLLSSKYPH